MPMTGDELITYGFKRISDLLADLKGQSKELNDYAYQISEKQDQLVQANKYLANISNTLGKIENHLFTMTGTLLAMQEKLDQTRADTYTTALNVIRIEQALNKEDSADEHMEGSI